MANIKSNNAVNPVMKFLKDMYSEPGLYKEKTASRVADMLDDSKEGFEQYRKLLSSTSENSAVEKIAKSKRSAKEISDEAVKNLDTNLDKLKGFSKGDKYSSNANAEAAAYRAAMSTNGTKVRDRKLKSLYEDELARTTGQVRRGSKFDTSKAYLDPSRMNTPQMIARYGAIGVGAIGVGNLASSIGNGSEY